MVEINTSVRKVHFRVSRKVDRVGLRRKQIINGVVNTGTYFPSPLSDPVHFMGSEKWDSKSFQ